jgi:hypothetical protein
MMDWEKDLPPIARARLIKIGEVTEKERERMIDCERVDSLLSEFHQGAIDAEGLWKRLRTEGRPSLLRVAQARLIESLSLGASPAELQRRKEGILAIETLKDEQNTSILELDLNLIDELQKRYRSEVERAYSDIRVQVERNPQLRVKQVQQGQRTVLVHMTIDEAIRQLPQWQEFLSEHEGRYSQEFARVIDKLKRELR